MSASFKNIALLGRYSDPAVRDSLLTLAEYLANTGVHVLVDANADMDYGSVSVHASTAEDLPNQADLIIVVGGDGSMLRATHLVAGRHVPLLGINRGRLGFLADVTPNQAVEHVGQIIAGNYESESRLMLEAHLVDGNTKIASCIALNDVVMQRGNTGRMLDVETWIDGRFVNTHGGDGLIVSTPTGSTAYALSCGGPIVDPSLDALVLVPICPHTLSDRPIVVPTSSQIEIGLRADKGGAQITCDGRALGEINAGQKLRVCAAEQRINMIHPAGYDYFRVLRSKLHWGGRNHDLEQE